MTVPPKIELIAAYFTIAGDVYPFGPTEISPFPFRDRVEAAARAGWKGVGMILADLEVTAAKIGLDEMRNILDANGMRYVELEFLTDWFRDGERRKKSDSFRQRILQMAGKLGARDVKTAPGLGIDIAHPTPEDLVPDVPRMTEEFARLCQDAAEHGTNAVLEIMPFSNVRTLETGRQIVEGANQPNGGLLLDIWHMARGGNAYSEIAKTPGRLIGSVELDDADADVKGTLWEDTIYHRRLPGQGVLDCRSFVKAVQTAGFTGAWSVEVISETFRKRPLKEMATTAFDATMAQFSEIPT